MIATAGLLTVPPEINNRRETPCGRGCLALLVAPPSRLSRVLIFSTGGGGYASKVTTRIGDLKTAIRLYPPSPDRLSEHVYSITIWKAYRYRLYLTIERAAFLNRQFGSSRYVYN